MSFLFNNSLCFNYEIKQINQEKQENIKNAQQAAGSLPDYLSDGEDDDDKSETE